MAYSIFVNRKQKKVERIGNLRIKDETFLKKSKKKSRYNVLTLFGDPYGT